MPELMDLASSVLDLATSGEDLEVYGVHTVATTVQAGDGAVIRRVDTAETRGVGIRVFRDERAGYASTSDLAPGSLEGSVERARANARASDSDPASRPPEPQQGQDRCDVPLLAPSTTLGDKIALVTRLANAVPTLDPQVRGVDTAEFADESREVVIVSTRGVRARHARGRCELWVDALGDHPAGMATDTGYWTGLAEQADGARHRTPRRWPGMR